MADLRGTPPTLGGTDGGVGPGVEGGRNAGQAFI
jgi:hypothetical protein